MPTSCVGGEGGGSEKTSRGKLLLFFIVVLFLLLFCSVLFCFVLFCFVYYDFHQVRVGPTLTGGGGGALARSEGGVPSPIRSAGLCFACPSELKSMREGPVAVDGPTACAAAASPHSQAGGRAGDGRRLRSGCAGDGGARGKGRAVWDAPPQRRPGGQVLRGVHGYGRDGGPRAAAAAALPRLELLRRRQCVTAARRELLRGVR